MEIIIFLFFIGILLVLDFINVKHRACLVIIAVLALGLIMGGAYDIPDHSMYENMYTASIMNFNYSLDYADAGQGGYSRNIGYTILNNILGNIGFSYQEYKFITSVVLLLLLLLFVRKITIHIIGVISLYLLYPFFMDIIQLRVFYTEVILLIAVYYLSKHKNQISGNFIFFCLIAIAGMFHSMAWLWILFVPFRLLIQSKRFKFIPWLFIIVGAMLPLYANVISSSFLPIMYMMAESDVTSHYQIYAMGDSVRLGYLYVWGYDLALIGLLYKIKNSIMRQPAALLQKNFILNTYILFLFVACILPASAIATESFRWSRVLMIESYISLVIYSTYESNYLRKAMIAFLLVTATGIAAYLNFYAGSAEYVLSAFTKNIFFDW